MPPEMPTKIPLETLRASRKNFAESLLQTMRAPDGSYEEGFVVPGSTTSPKSERMAANLEKNNPLSLDDEVWGGSCWSQNLSLNILCRTPGKNGLPLSSFVRQSCRMSKERETFMILCT
jgi:hypothetical protein